MIRRSSHCGKGTGGQIAQMRNIERVLTGASQQPRQLMDLNSATQGEEVNPMAPSHLDQEFGSQPIENCRSGRPQPRLCHVPANATASQVSPPAQPTFSLVAPGQHFSFRLPGTGQVSRGQVESSCGSVDSLLSSSCASTTFSITSHPSTTPTSRAASVCPSSQGDLDISQQQHAYGFSSCLKRLASASQSSVGAPAQISQLLSGTGASRSPNLPVDPPKGQFMLF